ncbi:hypothetical protein CCP3SC1AL1_3570001 [Gammaproteobacteria bacterium]
MQPNTGFALNPKIVAALAGIGLCTAVFVTLSHEQPTQVATLLATPSSSQINTSAQSLLERDTRLLTVTAAERLDAAIDPLFTDFHSHVPEFGEWAFGWRTGYRFMRQGMLTAITLPFVKPPRLEKIDSAWDDMIAEKFEELVLHPVGGIPALRAAHDRWLAEMRPTVEAVLNDTLRTMVLLRGQSAPLLAKNTANAKLSPATEEIDLFSAVATASGPIKARTARPLLARLAVRPPVAAAVTAAGEAIGHEAQTIFGVATNFAATLFAFFSIDYMLSQTDASLHRAGLEAEIHQVLENEHKSLRKSWLEEEAAEIETHMARLRPMMGSAVEISGSPSSALKHATPETAPGLQGQ